MKYKLDYEYDEVRERISNLEKNAKEVMLQKGSSIELTCEVLYFMSIVDKSIKLIDSVLYALEKNNVTVLAILTRVQMDCVARAYALSLVDNPDDLAREILINQKQMNKIHGKDNKPFTDKYLNEKVGEWLNLPVYDLYQKVCGFVHFSNTNFHTMIDSFDQRGFSMLSFSKKNPPEQEAEFRRLSLELANQFLFFGSILLNGLFDSWVKQRMKISD